MVEGLEKLLEWGGAKRDIAFLAISGAALALSLAGVEPFPFSIAWVAIILCGVPIILEAVIGLVTEFDITADVLVSLALIASVFIGEDFAAGEVAFIMQLGGLLEELTVGARPRRHRTARPSDAAHGTAHRPRNGRGRGAAPRGGGDHRGGSRSGGRHPTRAARGGRAVDGVIVSGQTSVNQAVHDRREPAGGQGPGGRGVVRQRSTSSARSTWPRRA